MKTLDFLYLERNKIIQLFHTSKENVRLVSGSIIIDLVEGYFYTGRLFDQSEAPGIEGPEDLQWRLF